MRKHWLVIYAISWSAAAAAEVPASIGQTCGDRAKGAKNAVLVGRHDGEVAYQISLPKGAAIASLTGGDDPCSGATQCSIFPIGKAPSVTGKLGASGASATAIVLVEGAHDGPTGSILVLRGKGGKMIDAIRVPDACSASLATIDLVPGQQSIWLRCAGATGADDQDLIVHAADGKLAIAVSLDGGATELDGATCVHGAVGGARVVSSPAGPRLRVTRAPENGQKTGDGSGKACARQTAIQQDFVWDADAKKIVSDGPGQPITKDTCGCKP
jgi:hypothetical protein